MRAAGESGGPNWCGLFEQSIYGVAPASLRQRYVVDEQVRHSAGWRCAVR
jgi:hypothetical protein